MVFWSCGYEPMTSVDYTFNNKSDFPLSMILNHSHGIKNDTIKIEFESFHIFEYSYEDVKTPPNPLYREGIDTIFLFVNDTIHTTYFEGNLGKSPFSLDSYLEVK